MTERTPMYAEEDVVRKTPLRQPSVEELAQIASQRDIAQEWIDLINQLPQNRELSIAKTKIEEAVMWAVKGLTT